jgi:7-cyano-7-deazaguanine synthase in queuosine biosynthesis
MKEAILPFSGGIDSLYCLWNYLVNNPEKTLVVHHVIMKNREGRWEKELGAVQACLAWLQENGLNNFEYIETEIDMRDLRRYPWDIVTVAFFTGVILLSSKYDSVQKVIAPVNKDEAGEAQYKQEVEMVAKRQRRQMMLEIVSNKPYLEVVYPIWEKTTRELIEELPPELFALSWYCRRPEEGEPCGKCFTCRRVAAALEIEEEA